MLVRSLLVSVLALLPTTAFAGAEIRARITDLRVQPSDQAKAKMKLGSGREVAVLGKSNDGQWVKVSGQLERGEDVIKFEGWVTADALSGDFGGAAVASASSDAGSTDWGDGGSESAMDAPAPASSAEAGDWDFSDAASASSSPSEPAGDNSWDSSSSSDSSSSGSTDWGDSGSDSGSSSESSDDSGDDWGDF